MFTGLIEKVSKLRDIKITSYGAELFYEADFENVKTGDSIAVNGVCLTVKSVSGNLFCVDVMNETLSLVNLKNLKKGDLVNLERAMSVNSRFDGHIVQGHIDCCAKVSSILKDGFSKKIQFECDNKLIVKKGSVAINGVSLTVSDITKSGFEVSLIPETIEKTNLKNIKIGDIVNIEYDVLGKYIKKFLTDLQNQKSNEKTKEESKITADFLKENGF